MIHFSLLPATKPEKPAMAAVSTLPGDGFARLLPDMTADGEAAGGKDLPEGGKMLPGALPVQLTAAKAVQIIAAKKGADADGNAHVGANPLATPDAEVAEAEGEAGPASSLQTRDVIRTVLTVLGDKPFAKPLVQTGATRPEGEKTAPAPKAAMASNISVPGRPMNSAIQSKPVAPGATEQASVVAVTVPQAAPLSPIETKVVTGASETAQASPETEGPVTRSQPDTKAVISTGNVTPEVSGKADGSVDVGSAIVASQTVAPKDVAIHETPVAAHVAPASAPTAAKSDKVLPQAEEQHVVASPAPELLNTAEGAAPSAALDAEPDVDIAVKPERSIEPGAAASDTEEPAAPKIVALSVDMMIDAPLLLAVPVAPTGEVKAMQPEQKPAMASGSAPAPALPFTTRPGTLTNAGPLPAQPLVAEKSGSAVQSQPAPTVEFQVETVREGRENRAAPLKGQPAAEGRATVITDAATARPVQPEARPAASAHPVTQLASTGTATTAPTMPLVGGEVTGNVATTSNPANSATAQQGIRPHDFTALVDRLVEAREGVRSGPVQMAVMHQDFGQVSLRFTQDSGAMTVAMTNHDPEFARAANAAVTANAADGPAPQEQGAQAGRRDDSGQNMGNSQRFASSAGQGSNEAGNGNRNHSNAQTRAGQAGPGQEQPARDGESKRNGIFA